MSHRVRGMSWGAAGGPSVATSDSRAQSARVKYPNTKESDQQAEVMHIVTMSDGTTVELMATDPMDAISKANK